MESILSLHPKYSGSKYKNLKVHFSNVCVNLDNRGRNIEGG